MKVSVSDRDLESIWAAFRNIVAAQPLPPPVPDPWQEIAREKELARGRDYIEPERADWIALERALGAPAFCTLPALIIATKEGERVIIADAPATPAQ